MADAFQPALSYPAGHRLAVGGEQLVQQTYQDVLSGRDRGRAQIRLPHVDLDVCFGLMQLGLWDSPVDTAGGLAEHVERGRCTANSWWSNTNWVAISGGTSRLSQASLRR